MRSTLTTTVGLCLLAAACSAGDPIAAGSDEASFPLCSDVPEIEAPADLYRDSPRYVGNEMPVEEVRTWAGGQPGYAGIWIDREHNGWVTVAFTEDFEQKQSEIEQRFPDDGVVAVEVPMSEEDLSELQTRIHEELEGVIDIQGSWTQINHGVVGVLIGVLSDENLDTLESRFPEAPLCVEGIDPADAVAPGPQLDGGDGWRLLLDEMGVGLTYRTGVAWDTVSLVDLFAQIGMDPVDVEVDFEDEVVIWFGAVYGSSCPDLRLDDVEVDGSIVYPMIVNTSNSFVCTDDAIPHTYLVAFNRDLLPEPPFMIQLGEQEPPDGVPEERTLATADLRVPGSEAAPGDVGSDPKLFDRRPRPEQSGTVIESGYPWTYEIDLSCGMESLGEVNSYDWEASSPLPETWLAATEGSNTVVVEILLHEDNPPSIEVTFEDATVVYEIADSPDCG